MAVRKIGRKWYVDIRLQTPEGRRRKRIKSPIQTKKAALEFEALLKAGAETPEPVKEVPTFRDYVNPSIEFARVNNKKTTLRGKEAIFKMHLIPFFGRMRLDQITRLQIEKYKAQKLEILKPKTINNHLTVLRKTLALAYEDEIIDKIPPVKWLRVAEQEFDFLEFDEAERLLQAADRDPLWYTMILVALRCGLRQGELLALRWDDLDLVAGRVMVRRRDWRGNVDTPKGGRSRMIPLSPRAIQSLKSIRHLRGDLVWCHEDGSPITYGQCKWPLYSACRLAGIRRIGWHVLRHTFASHLAMRGAHLKVIQEYLGHTDIRVTMRYAHLSPDVGRQAIACLDDPAPDRHIPDIGSIGQ